MNSIVSWSKEFTLFTQSLTSMVFQTSTGTEFNASRRTSIRITEDGTNRCFRRLRRPSASGKYLCSYRLLHIPLPPRVASDLTNDIFSWHQFWWCRIWTIAWVTQRHTWPLTELMSDSMTTAILYVLWSSFFLNYLSIPSPDMFPQALPRFQFLFSFRSSFGFRLSLSPFFRLLSK